MVIVVSTMEEEHAQEHARRSTSVQQLRDNRLAMETKKNYRSGLRQIEQWLTATDRSSMLCEDGSINLENFSYEAFTEFVLFKYRTTNCKPGTLASYRSAIKDYYKTSTRRIIEVNFY